METVGSYQRCKLYIESHTKIAGEKSGFKKETCPCVAISREPGAGSDRVGTLLTEMMSGYNEFCACEWTYFDQNLIGKVIQDHHLPTLISKYMVEDKYKNIDHIIYDFLGVSTSHWTLVHKTTETILQLARMGNVVIVGRAAAIITSKLKNAVQVRLVAPQEARINHIMELFNMNEAEAELYIKKEDRARRDYAKSYFQKDITDPALFHMIINTYKTGYEQAARIIADMVIEKFAPVFSQVNR
jgi:cytidylate kinase